MMEGYTYSPYSVIFFTLYVIIIIVVLLPTILAVVYSAYATQTEMAHHTVQKLQHEALHQAFDVLTLHLNKIKRHREDEVTLSLGSWVDLMKILRPDLSLRQSQV